MTAMERVTISLDGDLLAQFDRFLSRKGYKTRSEAVRDMVRERLETDRLVEDLAPFCVASLSYVYNHHERELARRITEIQHGHHDLIRSTLHVHLDHENCLEVSLLEGTTAEVRALGDAISSQAGVRHGQLNVIPVDMTVSHGHHADGQAPVDPPAQDHRPHVHTSPKT